MNYDTLMLILSAKMLMRDDRDFELNQSMPSSLIEMLLDHAPESFYLANDFLQKTSPTPDPDAERREIIAVIADLLYHRLITANEYDALYTSVSLLQLACTDMRLLAEA
ncbi:MAG: hypothetical protein JXK05_09600 [Campylobacterales bacterium]|nr:hypothetical protein [Campylobacterales bacterium]